LGKKNRNKIWNSVFGLRSSHKRSPEGSEKSQISEPAVSYNISVINFANQLISASASDLENLQIPGYFVKQLESATDLDAIQLASILGMSKSKYYRVLKEEVLELNEVDVLASLLKLWKMGINAFDQIAEDFDEFLNTTNTNLGRKPIDLLKTENGRREVEKALGRIEYGLYG
jgi:putative toxin-antitoxin system antitoxin component (TIGR02293 family)